MLTSFQSLPTLFGNSVCQSLTQCLRVNLGCLRSAAATFLALYTLMLMVTCTPHVLQSKHNLTTIGANCRRLQNWCLLHGGHQSKPTLINGDIFTSEVSNLTALQSQHISIARRSKWQRLQPWHTGTFPGRCPLRMLKNVVAANPHLMPAQMHGKIEELQRLRKVRIFLLLIHSRPIGVHQL